MVGHILKVTKDLELLAVAENAGDVRVRYPVPDLVETDDVVEPGDFAAKLLVVFLSPLLLCLLVLDELPDRPLLIL